MFANATYFNLDDLFSEANYDYEPGYAALDVAFNDMTLPTSVSPCIYKLKIQSGS